MTMPNLDEPLPKFLDDDRAAKFRAAAVRLDPPRTQQRALQPQPGELRYAARQPPPPRELDGLRFGSNSILHWRRPALPEEKVTATG